MIVICRSIEPGPRWISTCRWIVRPRGPVIVVSRSTVWPRTAAWPDRSGTHPHDQNGEETLALFHGYSPPCEPMTVIVPVTPTSDRVVLTRREVGRLCQSLRFLVKTRIRAPSP